MSVCQMKRKMIYEKDATGKKSVPKLTNDLVPLQYGTIVEVMEDRVRMQVKDSEDTVIILKEYIRPILPK